MIISLTGFMGCGKSSVGRQLSTLQPATYPERAFQFVDLDDRIVQRAGMTVPAIFASHGEEHFRLLEHICLQQVTESFLRHPKTPDGRENCLILALGGGTVLNPACFKRVHEKTSCIYLRASVDTLLGHLGTAAAERPMLRAGMTGSFDTATLRARITSLLAERSERYESVSRHIVDTDGKTPDRIAREISLWLSDLFHGWVQ